MKEGAESIIIYRSTPAVRRKKPAFVPLEEPMISNEEIMNNRNVEILESKLLEMGLITRFDEEGL